jgi:endogenous inhibitor of DNA gyrase (YacG/DUF329 family)
MSLARYVMAIGLGRELPKTMAVDHIDGDPHNDVWTNLQLLTVKDNAVKGGADGKYKQKMLRFTCPICTKRVVRRDMHGKKFRANVLCCSRKCSYAFISLSRHHTDKSVIRKAKKTNNIKEVIRTVQHQLQAPVGERIPFKTKGMRRVHNFTKRKGVKIL